MADLGVNRSVLALPYYSRDSSKYKHIQYRIMLTKYGMKYFVLKSKEWQANNKEKVRASWTRFNAKRESKEYRQQYYLRNKERISKEKKQHRLDNIEVIKKRAQEYYIKNHITIQTKTNRYYHTWKNYNKYLALFHYTDGEMCCKICGENIFELLTIDHINGGGSKHRKAIGSRNIHVWLRNNGFPEGYQVLCYNCNCVKSRVTTNRFSEIIKELQSRKLYMDKSMRKVI